MFTRIRRIVQHFRTDTSSVPPRHSGHDLAQAAGDASHVRGGGGGGGGGFSTNSAATEQMAKGAGHYSKSFGKKS